MRYFVLIVLAAIAAWYFFLRDNGAPDPNLHAVQMSPEKQFASLLTTTPIEAEKLAALCQAYPQLAAQTLKNREFKLHGVIRDFRLTGIDGRRAEILLKTETARQLIIVYNLDQYFRTSVVDRKAGRYTIVDTELFHVMPDGTGRKLLFAKELEITQTVVAKSFGATNISFLAVTNAPGIGVF